MHAVAARSIFPSQNSQNTNFPTTFASSDVEIARRCGAKHILKSKCQNITGSNHFCKFGCWKIAPRCGAKRVSESKRAKHIILRFWKFGCRNCTPLWRETHVEVKMHNKTHHSPTTFRNSDVEIACHRGGKHISKSKCQKHGSFRTAFGGREFKALIERMD